MEENKNLSDQESNSGTVAGYTAAPFFDENIIKKATQITLWEKLQLLFRRKRYYKTVEDFIVTRLTYKTIKDKKYILNFEQWQEPPQHFNCRCKTEAV
ncbi:MAG: hypothetical protein KKB34_10300 [Bacteroidetes bacterium]|nr:hypothetical protein [Bacteroidota bacterium]